MVFLFVQLHFFVCHGLRLSLLWNVGGTWVERRMALFDKFLSFCNCSHQSLFNQRMMTVHPYGYNYILDLLKCSRPTIAKVSKRIKEVDTKHDCLNNS